MDHASVAGRLARELTDQELERIFPELPAGTVRDLLQDTGNLTDTSSNTAKPVTQTSVQSDTCSLYTDGASRGNPGLAGAGMVLFDAEGREIAAESAFLGRCTNNVAEYRALLLGLELARQTGCEKLKVYLDSELIVRQLTGIYRVKNAALKPLYEQARQLLQSFAEFSVSHVVRAMNSRADELANQGIDNRPDSVK